MNSDPSALAASAAAPAEGTGLGGLANWRMLTGPLATLNTVWKAYGVSISFDPKTGQEAHNDVMDFIDQHGVLRYRAVPVADRERDGDVQPRPRLGVALGPGHRPLRREAGRAMTQAVPVPASDDAPKAPFWQRRRTLTIAIVVLAIAVVTVLTDLPVSTSRASDISAEQSVMSEVNGDLGPCALGMSQAIGIWKLQAAHQLSPADRAPTPGLLNDDQVACSLASEGIYDLSDITVPETPAGKHLGQMVGTALLWTTSDALGAIEDVQTLMNHPGDTGPSRAWTRRSPNSRPTATAPWHRNRRPIGHSTRNSRASTCRPCERSR